MRLHTLGRLELEGDCSPGPKALFLLVYLALDGPKERRFLSELLWRGTTDPRNRLSTALTRIRRCGPDLVAADAASVRALVGTDAAAFLDAWREGRYEDAVALYGGRFLEGFDPGGNVEVEEWLHDTRDAVERHFVDALLSLAEGAAADGDYAAALARAEAAHRHLRAVAGDPDALERLHVLLRAGGSPLATEVASDAAEYGVDLSLDRLRARRALAAEPAAQIALPVRRNPILGREREAAELQTWLTDPRVRLVTLTGPGGVGKSRLALEVAWSLDDASAFPGGVVFVSIAQVRRPEELLDAVARGAGVRETADRGAAERLVDAFAQRRALLVLDNAEQVLAGAREIGQLLERCPELTILVTSRAPLRLALERRFPVEPLAVDGADGTHEDDVPTNGASARDAPARDADDAGPAVALFEARARAIDPTFRLDAATRRDVVELCARLDGLPLALELAAARIGVASPGEMVARLESRLDLLGGAHRDAARRHRTLRETLAWSHDLLDASAQRCFRRVAIFAGRFTLDAATAVVEDGSGATGSGALEAMSTLVDHNLLRAHRGATTGFSFLETIHAFAREQLDAAGEREEAERRRAAYVASVAARAADELTGPQQARWLERLEELHADAREVLAASAARGEPLEGLRLAASLWRYWIARGHMREAKEHLMRFLGATADGADPAVRAEAQEGLGIILQALGEPHAARARLLDALAAWEHEANERRVATALNHLAWVALNLGDLWEAEAHARRALDLHRTHDDARGRAVSLNNLGWIAMYRGRPAEAARFLEDALRLREEARDARGVAFARANLAWARRHLGHAEEAEALLAGAEDAVRRLGDDQILGWIRTQQTALALERGDVERARTLARACLDASVRSGNRSGIAIGHATVAEVQLRLGDAAEARTSAETARSLAVDLAERWTHALAASVLGRAKLACGDVEGGRADLRTAAELHRRLGNAPGADALARTADRPPDPAR